MTGFRKKIVEPPRSLISDAIALLAILAVGTVYLLGSPEIAADLPDDGPSYAIPAVNFLDGKGWGWLAYGQRFGPSHPFGTSLMLLPGYLLAGHFIGNGILSLWFYTMCIAVMVYVVGRIYWGQVAGCLAALFFVGHHGVRLYTQRIMSEVPTLFVYTLVLVLLLYLRKRANARWGYVVLGIVLGLGVVIRVDNWLLVAAAFFLLIRRPLKLFVVHACLVVAGMAP